VGERLAGGVEAEAGARVGRDFEDAEVEALDRVEKPEVGGRLERDGVAGLGDGTEREIERLGAADGDDEFVVTQRAAGLEITAGDFARQRVVGGIHRVTAEERGVVAADGGEDAREFLRGEERMVRTGGAEGNVARVDGQGQHLGGEVVHADIAWLGHRAGHAWLGGVARQPRADIVTRLRTRLHPAAVFEECVGLEHSRDAHIALERHPADGRQPVAGAQGPLFDQLFEGTGQLNIERRRCGCREGLDHGKMGTS